MDMKTTKLVTLHEVLVTENMENVPGLHAPELRIVNRNQIST